MSSGMNPLSAAIAGQVSSAYRLSTRQSGRSWSPAAASAAGHGSGPGPAATVQLSTLPASVDADDRATYMALLKANQGNVGASLSALKGFDSAEKDG